MLEHVTDQATRVVSKLISQYQGTVHFRALIEQVLAPEFQEIEDVLWDLLIKHWIDNASGYTLERIARWVGMRDSGLPDADKRQLIRARIKVNRSKGTIPNVRAVFEALASAPDRVRLEELFAAGLMVRVDDPDFIVTNHATASEDLSQLGMGGAPDRMFLTTNAATAPDGTQTADLSRINTAVSSGFARYYFRNLDTDFVEPGTFNLSCWAWIEPYGDHAPPETSQISLYLFDNTAGAYAVPGGSSAALRTITRTPTRFNVPSTVLIPGNAHYAAFSPFNGSAPFLNTYQVAIWGLQLTRGSGLKRYVPNPNTGLFGVSGGERTSPDPALLAKFLREARSGGVGSQLAWYDSPEALVLDGTSSQSLDLGRMGAAI